MDEEKDEKMDKEKDEDRRSLFEDGDPIVEVKLSYYPTGDTAIYRVANRYRP